MELKEKLLAVVNKLTVKTTDGQIHKYNKVRFHVEDETLVVELTRKDTIVFPFENIIFYSYKS